MLLLCRYTLPIDPDRLRDNIVGFALGKMSLGKYTSGFSGCTKENTKRRGRGLHCAHYVPYMARFICASLVGLCILSRACLLLLLLCCYTLPYLEAVISRMKEKVHFNDPPQETHIEAPCFFPSKCQGTCTRHHRELWLKWVCTGCLHVT